MFVDEELIERRRTQSCTACLLRTRRLDARQIASTVATPLATDRLAHVIPRRRVEGRNHVFEVGGPIAWSRLLHRTTRTHQEMR